MFYDPSLGNHGLPHDPLKAIVAPRPIGWISTLSQAGQLNLAPYSFFNLVSERPAVVAFSSHGRKDTLDNIEATGEFVCNFPSFALRDQVNGTSAPLAGGESEMLHVGLEAQASERVRVPRVATSPAALECFWVSTTAVTDRQGKETGWYLVLGEVGCVFVDEAYIEDGRVRTDLMQPLTRCGYHDYATIEKLVSIPWK